MMKAAGPLVTPEVSRPRVRGGGAVRSPLRRSDVHNRIHTGSENVNDDDAERQSLVASERTPSVVASSTPLSRKSNVSGDSINSSPQKEHFQGCLKLYAENKINKDNAWNLRLIDFMTSMLRRHDARMENLQLASTVVDASTRIYSFRVDAIHHEVLKMAGGLVKAAQAKRGRRDDDGADDGDGAQEGEGGGAAGATRRKKKKTRGAIATAPETLNGDFDANEVLDPFFERSAATTGDVTSSNRAFNATLPIHDDTLALILRMDDLFLESVKENIPEDLHSTERATLATRLLPAFTQHDHICEPFTNFSISNWDPESEDSGHNVERWVEENRLNLSQQALAFDVNAEVEPVRAEEDHNDLFDEEPLAGIESDEEADPAVAQCVARVPPPPLARLTDMRPTLGDHRLEYSYCSAIVSAWAGPSHWRLKNNRASNTSERTASVNGRTSEPTRRPTRTKRQLDFTQSGVLFDRMRDAPADYAVIAPAKILISRKTLAQGATWSEKNYKTPIDRGLDETHFQKLFLKRSALLLRRRDLERVSAAENADPVHVQDGGDYDYDNENDSAYCPNSLPEGAVWGQENEEGVAAGEVHDQLRPGDELGDMLEPPTKVAKIFIPYAMRAKKVDMKQLKHCTWRLLNSKQEETDQDRVPETTFTQVYSNLPHKLSSHMRESLSVPLALLAVLHLANERGLVLHKHDDNRDFGILGLVHQ